MAESEPTSNALAEWLESLSDADLIELARQLGGQQRKRDTAVVFIRTKPEAGIRAAWAAMSAERLAVTIEAEDASAGRLHLPFAFSYNRDYVLKVGRNVYPRHVAEHISAWLKESRVFHRVDRT